MRPIILTKELLSRGSEDEKGLHYFREYLSQGTSLGETLELLSRVSTRPQQSCQELLASIDIESVFYYQMLHKVEQAFSQQKIRLTIGQRLGKAMLTEVNESEIKFKTQLIEARQKTLDQHRILHEQLEAAHKKLQAELYPRLSEIFKANEPLTFYLAALEKIATSNTFSGRILIRETDASLLGKNKLTAVRAIFFQYSPGQYRFYNGLDRKEGFYAYPNKEKFMIALREQLLVGGSDLQIQFSI